ncbi:MAG TPA: ABC transporter ATP-binding protein [Gemmatimonadaceae bacterium]|nr:ABC transporter ATP-binding protein [Gemmatimonadaceae bacterium]
MTEVSGRGAVVAAISARDIWKRYGAVAANRGAWLEVAPAEIHAVVGENGAGKTTLMRIVAGLLAPDSGTVTVEGRVVTGWKARDAIAAGVGMVHQHFMLVPTLTVAENVVLGMEPRWLARLLVDRSEAVRRVRELCERSGLAVDPAKRVAELTVGEAQRVEILKTLWRGARILILDEPTAVLSPPEVRELWNVVRALRDAGTTVVLITHKLDEVLDISDNVTVMRSGTTVQRLRTSRATPQALAQAMLGRELAPPVPPPRDLPPGRVLLSVRDLVVENRGYRAVAGVSFDLRGGEIFGIAGVEGNGQTELVEALAGLRVPSAGSVLLDGREITRATVHERTRLGLAHIPEDRQRRGLVLDFSVARNLVIGRLDRFQRRFVLAMAAIAANARRLVEEFDVRPADPSLPARALSGGNQQKVVVAREMGREYSVLLAAQPTRGVDVGAAQFIRARLRQARDSGKAVLMVSADLDEILELADRVGVFFRGRMVAVLSRSEATPQLLGSYMTRGGSRDS